MAYTTSVRSVHPIHPIHAIFVAGILPLFGGAALSDLAFFRTFEIQWQNFASWLIVGGLVWTGVALVFALFDLTPARRTRNRVLYLLVLLATFIVGFFNALQHARDAWASMPAGLVMSVIVLVLSVVALCLAFCGPRIGEVK
ncbi:MULTISPECIES: DUF2231 domain-containing protein [unclassified Luteimonas]